MLMERNDGSSRNPNLQSPCSHLFTLFFSGSVNYDVDAHINDDELSFFMCQYLNYEKC